MAALEIAAADSFSITNQWYVQGENGTRGAVRLVVRCKGDRPKWQERKSAGRRNFQPSLEKAMSNIHNAGPDDEISDADEEADISDSSVENEGNDQQASKQGSVSPVRTSRSATNPEIKNH